MVNKNRNTWLAGFSLGLCSVHVIYHFPSLLPLLSSASGVDAIIQSHRLSWWVVWRVEVAVTCGQSGETTDTLGFETTVIVKTPWRKKGPVQTRRKGDNLLFS